MTISKLINYCTSVWGLTEFKRAKCPSSGEEGRGFLYRHKALVLIIYGFNLLVMKFKIYLYSLFSITLFYTLVKWKKLEK